jgi:hypothetical protein
MVASKSFVKSAPEWKRSVSGMTTRAGSLPPQPEMTSKEIIKNHFLNFKQVLKWKFEMIFNSIFTL